MASQVQIPFEGVILQEHSAPISCPTPNFAKGSFVNTDTIAIIVANLGVGLALWRAIDSRHKDTRQDHVRAPPGNTRRYRRPQLPHRRPLSGPLQPQRPRRLAQAKHRPGARPQQVKESKGTLLTCWNNFVPASEFWLADNERSTFRQALLKGSGAQQTLSRYAVSSPSGHIQCISESPRPVFPVIPVIQQRPLRPWFHPGALHPWRMCCWMWE